MDKRFCGIDDPHGGHQFTANDETGSPARYCPGLTPAEVQYGTPAMDRARRGRGGRGGELPPGKFEKAAEAAKLIRSHMYDAGWPRDDSKGCVAERGGGREAACGRPLNKHARSEYGDGPEDAGWPVDRNPGDMHEPPAYTGELDWHDDGSELLHPFFD